MPGVFWYAPEVPAREGAATQLNRTRGGESSAVRYSEAFKEKMVQKMTGPNGRSATSLSEDVGVPQATLSRWLKQAGTVPAVSKRKTTKKKRRRSAGSAAPKRPQDWSAKQKLQVVLEAAQLSDDELGEFLRRKGLHEAQLEEWRQQAMEALAPRRRRRARPSPEAKRIRELEKELRRKDKALAEAAALIVLKKKAQAIWGDEDDDTDPRSGR